jgi:hypothetical protein
MNKPFFITIDTEPDNQWINESFDSCENIRYLPRFQELCEKYGFKPVYLTEYNVAKDSFFRHYIGKKAAEGYCEIGIHPHAWSTPPYIEITSNDKKNKPFLIDYPIDIMIEKFKNIFNLITETFHENLISHRAGRFAFNHEYLAILKTNKIKIDCSVLPYEIILPSSLETRNSLSFMDIHPKGYEMSIKNISKPGNSGVCQIPITVVNKNINVRKILFYASRRIAVKYFPNYVLRPSRNNIKDLLFIVDYAIKHNFDYLEFIHHSSELMPGCSPTFNCVEDIEKLYHDLETLFSYISQQYIGMTFREYYTVYKKSFEKEEI